MNGILKTMCCAWIANILCDANILISIITTFALMVLFNVWKELD